MYTTIPVAYTNATEAIFRRNTKGAPFDRFYSQKIYLGQAAFEYFRRAIMLGRVIMLRVTDRNECALNLSQQSIESHII